MWGFLTALVTAIGGPIVNALTKSKEPTRPDPVDVYRGQAAGRAAHEAATNAKPKAK